MTDSKFFVGAFAALTGKSAPFPWQRALFEEFVKGKLPPSCNVPTGLGKTAVIPIWLIALANQPQNVPRRLVYVVNRRTVVDQATREAEAVRERLGDVPALFDGLSRLCAVRCKPPLAISTLRGQFADNREWSWDPARPAIIVGTVDMIGSRLLFSGYRCGFKSRPLHAGFLGQDTLLVHDEAHLEPAFQELLKSIENEQKRSGDFRPLRVMELTATSRGRSEQFGLTDEEKEGKVPEVRKRMQAKKTIRLHGCDDEKKVAEQIADLALAHRHSGQAILVFVRTVDDVNKIATRLKKDKERFELLTGTLRGKERDKLVESPVFRRFMPNAKPDSTTVYLVCTSAGEVGINISADHLVCDLTPFESMVQRFGRVNRFGDGDARIDIAHPVSFDGDEPLEIARARTLNLLDQLRGDASPAALSEVPAADRQAAFTPTPQVLPTSEILFDAWTLTSIAPPLTKEPLPGRPRVTDYLHGVPNGWQPPETYVAWRREVEILDVEILLKHKPEDLLEDYPLKPHELLRDRTSRVFERLEAIATRLAERLDRPGSLRAWVIDPDGDVAMVPLERLIARDRQRRPIFNLAECTVVLSPSAGGLENGMLDGDSPLADDVADEWYDESGQPRRERVIVEAGTELRRTDGMRLVRNIPLNPPTDDEAEALDEQPAREWRWYVRPRSADDDGSKTAMKAVALQVHLSDVERVAAAIAAALQLPEKLRTALLFAARLHDTGKDRPLWQRSIGNPGASVLAKSGNRRPPDIATPYRHEFGSVLDIDGNSEFLSLDSETQDLVLHLIAAHHGRGRPHFPRDELYDPGHAETAWHDIARAIPKRFARLQSKYGRWGLAYLESLLRAADAEASVNPSQVIDE
ncbi:MAG: type I-U CRISPR-associated helicase/endonuclease Cas3 [Pirellulales bacterium]